MAKKSKKTHVIAVTIAVECHGIDEAVPHKGERLHHQLIKVSGVLRRSGETVFSREMKSSADVKNEEFFKRLTTCCVNGTVDVLYLTLLFHRNYSAAQPFVFRLSGGIHGRNVGG